MSRSWRSRAGLAAAIALLPSVAFAHAHLLSSAPAADSSGPAPASIELTFSQKLEAGLCQVQILDADGKAVAAQPLSATDTPPRLTVHVPQLAPGRYRLVWHATSVDTHRTEGEFGFTVLPR